jgi:hypothetical protein
MEPPRTRKGA